MPPSRGATGGSAGVRPESSSNSSNGGGGKIGGTPRAPSARGKVGSGKRRASIGATTVATVAAPKPQQGRIRVAVRCRPLSANELGRQEDSIVACSETTVNVVAEDGEEHSFMFNWAFGPESTSEEVFDAIAEPLVEQLFEGYNGTIFAYGQTGSGKTHSMMGSSTDRGVIPRVAVDIFDRAAALIASLGSGASVSVHASYIQIYNEKVQDLLGADQAADHKIREHPKRGTYVEGLSERALSNAEALMGLIEEGNSRRAVASTLMNAASSRSHVVVLLRVQQEHPAAPADGKGKRSIFSKMNLVDLAGSERASKTGAAGETLKEAIAINQSLSALGNVINTLSVGRAAHIPYRSSKLTHLLEESLGGNSLTVMLAAVSPAAGNAHETVQTLQYASRAKLVVTNARANDSSEAARVAPFGAEQAEALHEALVAKLEAAQSESTSQLLQQIEALQRQMGGERERTLEAQLSEARRMLASAESRLADAEARSAAAEARARKDAADAAQRLDAMRDALSSLIEKQRELIVGAIDKRSEEGLAAVADVSGRLSALHTGLVELQAAHTETASKAHEVHATTATEASRRHKALEEERTALRQRCDEADAQLAAMREELARVGAEADGLRVSLEQRDGQRGELQAGRESTLHATQQAESRAAAERARLHDERRKLEQRLQQEQERTRVAEAAVAKHEALLSRLSGALHRRPSPTRSDAWESPPTRSDAWGSPASGGDGDSPPRRVTIMATPESHASGEQLLRADSAP